MFIIVWKKEMIIIIVIFCQTIVNFRSIDLKFIFVCCQKSVASD